MRIDGRRATVDPSEIANGTIGETTYPLADGR